MPRYFFHIRDRELFVPDEEGSIFEDFETARSEAFESARELAAQVVASGQLVDGQRVELTDEQGQVLLAVPYRFVLRLPPATSI
jgi:hypothetical protein